MSTLIAATLRPPSVPLVLHDPYFSVWSPSEVLNEADTQHWTGAKHGLFFEVSIDGTSYRVLGKSRGPRAALSQKSLQVLPTRTIATFAGAGIEFTLTFLTPAIPSDLDLVATPLTYLIWSATATDGKTHEVYVKSEVSGMMATGNPDSKIAHAGQKIGGMTVSRLQNAVQPVLAHRGDWTQIDWGRLYFGGPNVAGAPRTGDTAGTAWLELVFPLMEVGSRPAEQFAIIAYDDDYSIQYFKQNLRGFWRRNGRTMDDVLKSAVKDLPGIRKRCEAFDTELVGDLKKAGGDKYAELCALAYRQSVGGSKLVADPNGQPMWFPKENTSNGCIGTTDVFYPMAPLALLFGPTLTKALITPVLAYAASPRWKFPFAPHDLGQYPQANGQVYGGGERTEENQMPVEESANMLILVAALAHLEGNADHARRYWPQLTQWAEYLQSKGFDPENQLCTDDFLGHLAHNVNLSAKAILGIKSYARLCNMLGKTAEAARYDTLAAEFAARWIKESSNGSSYRLTFDKPGTWSQKYNLVWDRILGFNLFPKSVFDQEMAHYRTVLNPFGLPLDSRGPGAKLDWSLWTATLTQRREDFDAILEGVYRYVNESPQRVGMGDWYDTAKGNFNFMHSRPVVGGVFLQLLYSKPTWTKWADQDKFKTGEWAAVPKPSTITAVVPAADREPTLWRFTNDKPDDGWDNPGFAAADWKEGLSGFGSEGTPGGVIQTPWTSSDIWLRRKFALTKEQVKDLELWIHHDNDVEVYLNGVLALKRSGWTTQYENMPILPSALKALRAGDNTLAVHCHQVTGGQYIDVGLIRITPG